jgi:hypothetical protein
MNGVLQIAIESKFRTIKSQYKSRNFQILLVQIIYAVSSMQPSLSEAN